MRATMSAAPLLSLCQYSFRDEVPWIEVGDHDHLDFGNAVDAWVRWFVTEKGKGNPPIPPATVDVSDYALTCQRIEEWLVAFGHLDEMRVQVAFAWTPATDTARELVTVDRDYSSKLPGEYPGTTDIVVVTAARVIVIDIKTGYQTPLEQYDAQLDDYGLALARTYQRDAVTVITLKGTTTRAFERRRELDAFDLNDVASLRRAQLEAVPTSTPVPGAHCTERWCKAIASCPATQAAAEQLLPVTSLVKKGETAVSYPMTVQIQSPEHALWLRDRAKMIQEMAGEILDAVKDYARKSGGIPVGDGKKVWTEVPSTRSGGIDGKKALDLLENKYGASNDDLSACMKPSIVVNQFREVNAKGRAA